MQAHLVPAGGAVRKAKCPSEWFSPEEENLSYFWLGLFRFDLVCHKSALLDRLLIREVPLGPQIRNIAAEVIVYFSRVEQMLGIGARMLALLGRVDLCLPLRCKTSLPLDVPATRQGRGVGVSWLLLGCSRRTLSPHRPPPIPTPETSNSSLGFSVCQHSGKAD